MRRVGRVFLAAAGFAAFTVGASAQSVVVGGAVSGTPASVTGPHTWNSLLPGANAAGLVTTATFAWSSFGCPAAAKIKFFRPTGPSGYPYRFLAERGPYDVPAVPEIVPAIVSVRLDPPVAVEVGDVIGISNVGSCGGPTHKLPTTPLPTLPLPTLLLAGDVTSDVTSGGVGDWYVWAQATSVPVLSFFDGRFTVSLTATDPRTGTVATGFPTFLGATSGFFSLPELTGTSGVPEVTVKMVDATGAPPPFGGKFWFFQSSLTDTEYTLTVTDRFHGTRIYGSSTSAPFCGTADTDAFPP